MPCHLLPLRSTSNFHFFSSSSSFWEQRRMTRRWVLLSSLLFISLLIQQSILRASIYAYPPAACLPSSSARLLLTPPASRCGRPVSDEPIGKQRPKMNYPVSFPSSMNKHSNRSRKNIVGPHFLLTMNPIAAAPRPSLRKFDKFQNL